MYFGLFIEPLTDLAIQTAFWQLEGERHAAKSYFTDQDFWTTIGANLWCI